MEKINKNKFSMITFSIAAMLTVISFLLLIYVVISSATTDLTKNYQTINIQKAKIVKVNHNNYNLTGIKNNKKFTAIPYYNSDKIKLNKDHSVDIYNHKNSYLKMNIYFDNELSYQKEYNKYLIKMNKEKSKIINLLLSAIILVLIGVLISAKNFDKNKPL